MSAPDHTTLCWGTTENGELGLGGVEDELITEPHEISALQNQQVVGMACGQSHTVFLMDGGVLCSCGNNDSGQLGHDKPNRTKPETISTLETQVVVQVGCGSLHTVAVTDTGQMFSWGSNLKGQLGRGYTDETFTKTPKLVKSLSTSFVISLACGENHNLALTNDGHVYSWGENVHGQLGLGVFSPKAETPQLVTSLSGVPISLVKAGGQHSLALTYSGALFSWGKNSFGQLGIGNQEDRFYPTLVKQLRYQRITYVDSGEDHSVALTADGGLFTFGAGAQGQLGHNSTNNELQPRQVFELMGSVVSQVATGRRHTVAYIPSSGRIYAFGLGGHGQLGVGEFYNRNSPTTVKGPFIPLQPSASCPRQQPISDKLAPCVNRSIYCGGDHTFTTVTALRVNHAPDDFRIPDRRFTILSLTSRVVDELVSVPPSLNPSLDTIEHLEKIFQSLACLNASFLLPDQQHFGCGSKNHGVNIEQALEAFKRLRTLPNSAISNKVEKLIESHVLPTLENTRLPDVEAMRIFILIPLGPIFEKPQYYSSVHCPFARIVTTLDRTPGKIIDLWWSQLPTEYLTRLIQVYKQAVMHVLHLPTPNSDRDVANRQNSLMPCMDMLKKLNEMIVSNSLLPYDAFYIPELKDKLDIRMDYINWLKQSSHAQKPVFVQALLEILESREQGRPLSFCNYPFVFDAQAKTLLLQTDAMLQMQVAIDTVVRRNMTSMIIPEIDPINPCLILYVGRENIVQDTINQLDKQGSANFKKPLKVMFAGEEALDAGGVKKEFFLLILREVVDPKYGMFQYFEESRLFWFNSETFEDPSMFMLIGILCGLAIYNAIIIDLQFPLALFKKLLGGKITMEDLVELDPTVGRSMQDLLKYEGNDVEDVFCLNFAISRESYGRTQTIDLVPGGSDIEVTKANKAEYVNAYLDYVFNSSTNEQFEAFHNGFHRVCGGKVLHLFHPQELQAMVVGNENFEWDLLEKNCEYKPDYHLNHTTIRYFWDVFRELSLDDKKRFLRFLTGSDRIPIHGMKAIKMFIQPTGGGDKYLPVAHTCFNLLDLPRYTSRDILQHKLLTAIQQTEGFGIV